MDESNVGKLTLRQTIKKQKWSASDGNERDQGPRLILSNIQPRSNRKWFFCFRHVMIIIVVVFVISCILYTVHIFFMYFTCYANSLKSSIIIIYHTINKYNWILNIFTCVFLNLYFKPLISHSSFVFFFIFSPVYIIRCTLYIVHHLKELLNTLWFFL